MGWGERTGSGGAGRTGCVRVGGAGAGSAPRLGGGTAGGWSSGVGGALRGRRSAGARRGTPCGHGPAAPRPACGRGPGGGTRRLGVDVGALARGACRAPRPPHPFQVPSASRRGGLKTPGGGCRPSALGFGAVGPAGSSRELPPVSPQTPPSPEGTGWRAAWRATVTAAAAVVWAVAVCGGACARCPASLGEGWGPPGRLWGCPSPPWRLGAGRPVVWNLSRPLRSAVFCLTWPARGNPLPQLPPPGREAGVGGMCRARGGCPAETKPLKTSYDS